MRQEKQDLLFKSLIDTNVKILYKDYGKISVARGTLISENKDFLILRGDFNQICLRKDTIVKITSQIQDKKEQENDNSE
jgi:hypothetical protein